VGGDVVQKESARMDRGVSLFVQCDVSQDETGECIQYGVFLLECIMAASADIEQSVSQARAGLKLSGSYFLPGGSAKWAGSCF
jgi:hypothetical protein